MFNDTEGLMQFKDRKEFEERLSKCIEDMNEILEDLRKNDDEKTASPDPEKLAEAKRIESAAMTPRGDTKPKGASGPQFPERRTTEPEYKKWRTPQPNIQETKAQEKKSRDLIARYEARKEKTRQRIGKDVARLEAEAKKKKDGKTTDKS